jgi:tetratricopeptide (TPR) repeat protein
MRFRRGTLYALIAALAVGGCASATAGSGAGGGAGAAGRTSVTGRVYEPGIPPRENAQSRAATIALATGRHDEALATARAGIAADSTNPIFYYIAGEAAAGLNQFELADSMWTIAQRMYPAYELDIEPSRENAWVTEYNRGSEAYNAGNMEAAGEAWASAHMLYKLRPVAVQNLGIVRIQQMRYDDAIAAFREGLANLELVPASRALEPDELAEKEESREIMTDNLVQILLFTERWADAEQLLRQVVAANPDDVEAQANLAAAVSGQGRTEEATQMYSRLLTTPNLGPGQLFNIGVSLFNGDQPREAAQAFARVTDLIPNHRDAWFNQANALYDAAAWNDLVPVAARLTQIDPLSETATLIHARAYRELGQNDQALEVLTRVETMPIYVEDLQISAAGDATVVQGRAEGNNAAAGTPVRLRFTFYGDNGQEVGTQTVTVPAPAREQSANFEVRLDEPAAAYRYEIAP